VSENNENIPLDEMMRNLKRGAVKKKAIDIESGEHVVRADGSKAIKVRTKKRRSVQPKKEVEQKSIKRKIVLIGIVVSLLLLSVVAYSFFLGYYNGSRFKSDVDQSIVNFSGADTELGVLNVSLSESTLSKAHLTWPDEGATLKDLTLTNLVANCGVFEFVTGGLSESVVGMDTASLQLELNDKELNLKISPERPFDYQFSLYQCSSLDVNFGEGSDWSFKEGYASYRPSGDVGNGKLSIDGGELSTPIFDGFLVKNGILELGVKEAKVFMGLDSKEYGGQINIDGVVGYNKDSLIDLKTTIRNYKLKGLLDSKTRRFFHGEVDSGQGTLKMKIGDINSLEMVSDLNISDVILNDFSFVSDLAKLMDNSYYTNPTFTNGSSMTVKRSAERTEFVNVNLLQEELMCVKGNVSIDEFHNLTGVLQVGLPVMVLSNKRNGDLYRALFSDGDGEFIWCEN